MRLRNWDVRLVHFQTEVLGASFVWGETDCASLVRRALEVMYSPDDIPLPPKLPRWTTEAGALRAHKRFGGVSGALEAGGAQRASLAFVQQGDVLVGLDPAGGVPGAAVVVQGGFLVASVELGVLRRRLRDLRRAPPAELEVWRPPVE
jgi:hypothetical protein